MKMSVSVIRFTVAARLQMPVVPLLCGSRSCDILGGAVPFFRLLESVSTSAFSVFACDRNAVHPVLGDILIRAVAMSAPNSHVAVLVCLTQPHTPWYYVCVNTK